MEVYGKVKDLKWLYNSGSNFYGCPTPFGVFMIYPVQKLPDTYILKFGLKQLADHHGNLKMGLDTAKDIAYLYYVHQIENLLEK